MKTIFVILVLSAGLLPVVTFISCYLTALKLGHLNRQEKLPLLTNLGDVMPEKIAFSIGFCITSLIQLIVVLLRYAQIIGFCSMHYHLINTTGCIFGCIMVLGQMILTSIRSSDAPWAHYLGKTIQFSSACIYITIQSYISLYMQEHHNRYLAYFRCILSGLTALCPFVLIFGLSIDTLKEIELPQAAEMALFLFTVLFWASLAFDFNKHKVAMLEKQSKPNPRIGHTLSCRRGDNHQAITYLHDVIDRESHEL